MKKLIAILALTCLTAFPALADADPLRRASTNTTSGTATITAPSDAGIYAFATVKVVHDSAVTDNKFFVEVFIDSKWIPFGVIDTYTSVAGAEPVASLGFATHQGINPGEQIRFRNTETVIEATIYYDLIRIK